MGTGIKICFFNHYHNGDCIATKQFVAELMEKLPATYSYAHSNHPKIIGDLCLTHTPIPPGVWPPTTEETTKFIERGDTFFINTWIGCYIPTFDSDNLNYVVERIITETDVQHEINWSSYYRAWSHIYSKINARYSLDLKLNPLVNHYFPTIDYAKFKYEGVDAFVANNKSKQLFLFSNGFALSGQCYKYDNMEEIIESVSLAFPYALILCTHRIPTSTNNIYFTQDIIAVDDGCDLNEISYLSTFCEAIVGRNSGPFLFTNTKENLNDRSKLFIVFDKIEGHCYPYELDMPCSFKFICDGDDLPNDLLSKLVCSLVAEHISAPTGE